MSVSEEYELCSQMRIVTAGNLVGAVILIELTIPDDLVDLSNVEEITLITLTESISAQLRWNIYLAPGYTRASELAAGPYALGTVLSANGSLRQAPYNALTTFLPACRFLLGYHNNSGALQESAVVSARILVKRIS